jgi:hypothetical protein
VKALFKPQLLFDDGYQDINRQVHPHLRLHGVLGGAVESSDVEMLFDPTEDQFYLATSPVQLGAGQREKGRIVGQEGQSQVLLGVLVSDAGQQVGIAPLERSTGREV